MCTDMQAAAHSERDFIPVEEIHDFASKEGLSYVSTSAKLLHGVKECFEIAVNDCSDIVYVLLLLSLLLICHFLR